MLVTPAIEKHLISGACVFKTINLGLTQSYTIPVPRGGAILLRQIIYYPFVSSDADFYQRSLVQLSLVEQGLSNELLYIFRNSLTEANTAAGNKVNTGGNPQEVETWAMYKKSCVIDINLCDNPTGWVYPAKTQFTPQAEERQRPLGWYNTVNDLQSQVRIAAGNVLYPTGQNRQFVQPFLPAATDRLRFENKAGNLFPNPVAISDNIGYEYPLFTFGYFEFNTEKALS